MLSKTGLKAHLCFVWSFSQKRYLDGKGYSNYKVGWRSIWAATAFIGNGDEGKADKCSFFGVVCGEQKK